MSDLEPVGSIEGVVVRINALQRASLLHFLLNVGRIVVDGLYGGDVTRWRQAGAGDVSFRQLADHPELDVNLAGLSRAIRVLELHERLRRDGVEGGVASLTRLSPSHFYAVLGLPYEAQVNLLTEADAARWTTRRLESEARAVRADGRVHRPGRRPDPRVLRTLRQVARWMESPSEAFGDLDALARLDEDEARRLWRALVAARFQLDAVERRLEAHLRR